MACQRRFRFFVSALIVLIANPLAAQEMDVTHQHLSLHSELVWQNVRDDRQLVDGAKPSYSIKHQLSVVCLKPGESIEFLVPENELVRALLCEGNDAFDQPISMWINDFDGNSFVDKILTMERNGKDMPITPKRDLVDQIISIKKQGIKHTDYATKSIQELLPKEFQL